MIIFHKYFEEFLVRIEVNFSWKIADTQKQFSSAKI